MDQCKNCGNHYSKLFSIEMFGQTHHFDCFECAITALAPRCGHCNTLIIGHGVEAGDLIYCCAHCSRVEGHMGLQDHSTSTFAPPDIR